MRQRLLAVLLEQEKFGEVEKALQEAIKKSKMVPSQFLDNAVLPVFFNQRVYENTIWQGLASYKNHFEVYGNRDVILDWLCVFMGYLERGDKYYTRTIPAYWTENNLGANGRFLVKNKDLAMKGVEIRRLFMTAYEYHELPINEQLALLEQHRACQDVWKVFHEEGTHPTNYSVRVNKVRDFNELLSIERRRHFVAYVEFGNHNTQVPQFQGRKIGFSFMSYGKPYQEFNQIHHKMQITKLRFRVLDESDKDKKLISLFDNQTDWKNPDSDDTLEKYLNSGINLSNLLQIK